MSLTITSCLAEGGFGKVYSATLNGVGVVLKKGRNTVEEAEILRKLVGAEGIVQTVAYSDLTEGIVLERMDGDLLGAMKEKRFTSEETLWVAKEVLTGLGGLEKLNITHGDVKPSNILLKYDPCEGVTRVRLADFGSATTDGKVPTSVSQGYRAPEAIIGAKESGACWEVDVWCLGVVMYECLAGENPFNCGAITALWKMCEVAMPPFPRTFPSVDAEYSETFSNLSRATTHTSVLGSDLVTSLLQLTPSSRPQPSVFLTSTIFDSVRPMPLRHDMTPPRQRGLLPIVASPPPELPEYHSRHM